MGPTQAQQGLHGNQALGFRGNSREEPGNASSGRKAAAVRREPRARLAEQAPDTLSVQSSGGPGLELLSHSAPLPPNVGTGQLLAWLSLFTSGCPGAGSAGVLALQDLCPAPPSPSPVRDSWKSPGRQGSVCPAWGGGPWVSWAVPTLTSSPRLAGFSPARLWRQSSGALGMLETRGRAHSAPRGCVSFLLLP